MSDLLRANALMDSKQYAAALPLLRAALRRSDPTRKSGESASAATALILDMLGECFIALRDFRAAAEHYSRAAAISDYGFRGRIIASHCAASTLFNLSDYAEAEKQTAISLAIIGAEATAGATAPASLYGHRAKASALSAAILENTGRYSEALLPLQETATYYESIGDTQNLIVCLSSLGHVHIKQGLSEKALALVRRAQALNPSTAAAFTKLGFLLTRLDLYNEAVACVQKALTCEEREHGKNTPTHADIQLHIGTLYGSLGQPDVALSWYQRTRTAYEKLNLTRNENFGTLLLNTGVAHREKCNLSEALTHCTRANEIFRRVLPPDHPQITRCMHFIADVNAALGHADAASAAAAAAVTSARRSQVQCAAAGCPRKVKADGSPLDQCGGCKRCYYCSKTCQTADWRAGRKAECKALRDGGGK